MIAIEPVRNLRRRLPINFPAKYVLNHRGGLWVDNQQVFILWGSHIPIDDLAAHKLAVPAFCLQVASDLNRNIPAVGIVHQISERQDQFIVRRSRLRIIIVVVDCNKPDAKHGEQLLNISPGVNILPAKAGQVFHNNAVYLSLPDRLYHSLKIRPVKVGAGIAVIAVFSDQCDFRTLFEKLQDYQSLIGDTVALEFLTGTGKVAIFPG